MKCKFCDGPVFDGKYVAEVFWEGARFLFCSQGHKSRWLSIMYQRVSKVEAAARKVV